ncbi:MAG: peptidoglycan DD-metalloendopeptidase family protein [Candidatus Doudnabacteria bacterium]|nr:peptidoglycan DD-metalloendopeptidase family protein [Candidatus Doudnabacteria bacterium]
MSNRLKRKLFTLVTAIFIFTTQVPPLAASMQVFAEGAPEQPAEEVVLETDNQPAKVQISTYNLAGQQTNHFNSTQLQAIVTGYDLAQVGVEPSGIKQTRFTTDPLTAAGEQNNWLTYKNLEISADCSPWVSRCNLWDGTEINEMLEMDFAEGRNTYYMQVLDHAGNEAIFNYDVIYDLVTPALKKVTIGSSLETPVEAIYTGSYTNKVFLTADDPLLNSRQEFLGVIAGLDQMRFSFDNITWQDWQPFSSAGVELTWQDTGANVLTIYAQVSDKAGNLSEIVSDVIYLDTAAPIITENILASGAEYISGNATSLQISAYDPIDELGNSTGIAGVRYLHCTSSQDCETKIQSDLWTTGWQDFFAEQQILLLDPEISGTKQVCAQVKDQAENLSNTLCDALILDNSAPSVNVEINSGASQTVTTLVNVHLAAQDTVHADGTEGVGQLEYQVSQDGLVWSTWQAFRADFVHEFRNIVFGEAVLMVRVRDGLGNVSRVAEDGIFINQFRATGSIVINDDAVFTNSDVVTLRLQPTVKPQFMKIWNQGENSTVVDLELFQTVKHWKLTESNGVKRVYVQYIYSNTREQLEPVYDEIILAPKYAVEYSSVATTSQEFTLSSLPQQVMASTELPVALAARNRGSMTWQPQSGYSGEQPVNISYHWYRFDEQAEDNIGQVYQYEGSRGILNKSVSYLESDDNIRFTIYTPAHTGKYVLLIDAVHEGNTWFSEWGNITPAFVLDVEENPEFLAPEDPEAVLGENDLGAGGTAYYIVQSARPWDPRWRCGGYDCYSGIAEEFYHCSARGIPNYVVTSTNPVDQMGMCWWPIYAANRHLYDGKVIPPGYRNNPWNWLPVGWHLVIPNVPDTWGAALLNRSHGGQLTVKQGEAVAVSAVYQNVGTGTWPKSSTRLGTQSPQDRNSVFSANWLAPHRTSSYMENANVLPNGAVTFLFDFNAPLNLASGTYTECFAPLVEGVAWMASQPVCWQVRVIPRELMTGRIFCTEGTDLYRAPGAQGFVRRIPYDSQVTILETVNGWHRISLEGDNQLWFDGTCFEQTGTVPNDEQSSSSVSYDPPTGDMGVVISTVGLKLRVGPGLQFGWDIEIPFGTEVKVLRQVLPGNDGLGGWYEVQLPDGTTGWVPAGYIDLAPGYNPPVWTPPQPLFSEAHICNTQFTELKYRLNWSSRTIETITQDANIRIIDVIGEWYYVSRLSGKSGYIHQSYVCEGFTSYGYGYGGIGSGVARVDGVDFVRPYAGNPTITSQFGPRWGTFHSGTDYGLACGTDIFASAAGVVADIATNGVVAGNNSTPQTPSNYIIIQHPSGWQSYYWHLSVVAVEIGQSVAMGEYIGKSGNTGWVVGNSSLPVEQQGCHLHFELRKNGVARDPEWVFVQKYYPPVNTNPSIPPSGGVQGVTGANPADPYAGMNGSQAAWPEVTYDRFIRWDGATKWNEIKWSETRRPQAPTITYAETAEDGNSVQVYGIGIPKNMPMHIKVWNEFRDCWGCGSGWEHHYKQDKAQHVKIVLFRDDWTYLGELWNDSPDGRWSIKLPLGGNLRPGDVIKAEVQIYSDYWFDGLKWWKDTYENGVHFNIWPLASGGGNRVGIPEAPIKDPVEYAFKQRELQLGDAVVDGVTHEWCGIKIRDYHSIGNYGDSVLMYNPSHNRAYLLTGGIWWSYYTYGGCGEFGMPLMDEGNTGRLVGWYQQFEKGNIYWSRDNAKSQPGIVRGAIKDHYEYMTGTWSYLGFPEGLQWGETSRCNTFGTMQHFTSGKIFSSKYGNLDIGYGGWSDIQNGLGGISQTGWPIKAPYNVSGSWAQWEMEEGVINWNFNSWFDHKGCGQASEREEDPANQFSEIIHAKENRDFKLFIRADNEFGKVHPWNCGGTTYWLADYDKIEKSNGEVLGASWVMVNNSSSTAYVITGKSKDYYLQHNGCEILGFPTMDTSFGAKPALLEGSLDWQTFSKGMYHYSYNLKTGYGFLSLGAWTNHHIEGAVTDTSIYSIYSQADPEYAGDAAHINGYLGAPVEAAVQASKTIDVLEGKQLNLTNAISFQGGYIGYSSEESRYVKILNSYGTDVYTQKLTGQTSFSADANAFIEGMLQGLVNVITDIVSNVIQFAIAVLAKVFGGVIGAVLNVAFFVVSIIRVIASVAENQEGIEYIFNGGDYLAKLRFMGSIVGSILGGILTAVAINSFADKAVQAIAKVGLLGQQMKKLADAGVEITSQLRKSLQTMMQEGEEGIAKADKVINAVTANSSIANRLVGDISKLTASEIDEVLVFLGKYGDEVFDFAEYTKFDEIGVGGGVSRYLKVREWKMFSSKAFGSAGEFLDEILKDPAAYIYATDGMPMVNQEGITHMYSRHIAISDADLMQRATIDSPGRIATKFYDLDSASYGLSEYLDTHRLYISNWLSTSSTGSVLDASQIPRHILDKAVGYGYLYSEGSLATYDNLDNILLTLQKTGNNKFLIITGYPTIK